MYELLVDIKRKRVHHFNWFVIDWNFLCLFRINAFPYFWTLLEGEMSYFVYEVSWYAQLGLWVSWYAQLGLWGVFIRTTWFLLRIRHATVYAVSSYAQVRIWGVFIRTTWFMRCLHTHNLVSATYTACNCQAVLEKPRLNWCLNFLVSFAIYQRFWTLSNYLNVLHIL